MRSGKVKSLVTLCEIIALFFLLSLSLPVFHTNFPLSPFQFVEVFRTNPNLMLCFHDMIVTVKAKFSNPMVTMLDIFSHSL